LRTQASELFDSIKKQLQNLGLAFKALLKPRFGNFIKYRYMTA
jgi:hypothetical protein